MKEALYEVELAESFLIQGLVRNAHWQAILSPYPDNESTARDTNQ
ncbi:hypothetical protein [Vulcanisaeta souniana]|nr:hypothetical protein [Vulcanisaeta souniana]